MEPAPLGRRAAAWAIDLAITVVLPFGLYLIVGLVFSDDVPLAVGVPVLLVLAAFHLLYAPLLLSRSSARSGQTLGKQALGLRVVRPGGERLGLGRALVREIVARSLLGLLPLYTVVDLATPTFNRSRRAIHDRLADTFVVPV